MGYVSSSSPPHLWPSHRIVCSNFRGERIIYELSPQEAMAQYTGDDPHQGSTVWLDSAFGMGGNVGELVIGYDCPYDAIYLDATVHESGSSTRRNAICVFEREGGRPLSRHTGHQKDEMGVVRGYELVVRTISTVGNYDYLVRHTVFDTSIVKVAQLMMIYLNSSTTHSNWMGRLKFACQPRDTFKVVCGTNSNHHTAIDCITPRWVPCMIMLSIVSDSAELAS